MNSKLLSQLLTPTILLAVEALPDPNDYRSVGWVIVVLAAIIWGINQALELFQRLAKRNRNDPGPTEAQFVTRAEWKLVHQRHDATLESIEKDIKELLQRTAPEAGYGRKP